MQIGSIKIEPSKRLFLICGPCVIESRDNVMRIAEEVKKTVEELPIEWIFKASYDKANRTSLKSFRGVGIDKGLEILSEVKKEFEKLKIPVWETKPKPKAERPRKTRGKKKIVEETGKKPEKEKEIRKKEKKEIKKVKKKEEKTAAKEKKPIKAGVVSVTKGKEPDQKPAKKK